MRTAGKRSRGPLYSLSRAQWKLFLLAAIPGASRKGRNHGLVWHLSGTDPTFRPQEASGSFPMFSSGYAPVTLTLFQQFVVSLVLLKKMDSCSGKSILIFIKNKNVKAICFNCSLLGGSQFCHIYFQFFDVFLIQLASFSPYARAVPCSVVSVMSEVLPKPFKPFISATFNRHIPVCIMQMGRLFSLSFYCCSFIGCLLTSKLLSSCAWS